MGLFGFGKKKAPEYKYKMLFSSPFNADRDQQIMAIVLGRLGDAGVHVTNVNTTPYNLGSKVEFTGEPGETITIEHAATPTMESTSSYFAITVTSNQATVEYINGAFAAIKNALYGAGIYFDEF